MNGARLTRGEVGRGCVGLAGLALLLLGGCLQDPTEIVVVADTDMTIFVDFDAIQFELPDQFGGGGIFPVGSTTVLPATMGFLPQENGRQKFDVIVRAVRNDTFQGRIPVVTRRVSNIPFVSGEIRAVFMKILDYCRCQGTTCAHALEPECIDITKPELLAFDEDNIPHL
jgi:hypothetical protein